MARIRVTAKQLGDRHYQINLSDRIALITQSLLRPGKGGRMARVKAAYFGFASYDQAQQFANEIRGRFPAARIQVRQGQRLACVFEVKVSHACVEELAWSILRESVSVSDRIATHIQQHTSKAVDRASAPMVGRIRPKTATVGRYTVSIE